MERSPSGDLPQVCFLPGALLPDCPSWAAAAQSVVGGPRPFLLCRRRLRLGGWHAVCHFPRDCQARPSSLTAAGSLPPCACLRAELGYSADGQTCPSSRDTRSGGTRCPLQGPPWSVLRQTYSTLARKLGVGTGRRLAGPHCDLSSAKCDSSLSLSFPLPKTRRLEHTASKSQEAEGAWDPSLAHWVKQSPVLVPCHPLPPALL